MTDPAHAAGTLVQEAFLPFFTEPLPVRLGREIYLTIRKRLQSNRYIGDEHTDEVFQQTLCDAFSYLKRHGGETVRHTRGWLHRISKNALLHYLEDRSTVDSPIVSSLDALIEGDAQFADTSVTSDGIALVRRAIGRLRPFSGGPRPRADRRLGRRGNPGADEDPEQPILPQAEMRSLQGPAARNLPAQRELRAERRRSNAIFDALKEPPGGSLQCSRSQPEP